MLEVKDAVKVSLLTFSELFPSEIYRDLRLEEVDLSSDSQAWKITVSYKNPDLEDELRIKREESKAALSMLGNPKASEISSRTYKSISIDAEDGSLLGIRSA